jgi:outer membrane immunogenic protein
VLGGTVGFNQHFGTHSPWGLEGDLDWANIKGSALCPAPVATYTCDTEIRMFGTGRLHVGVTHDRFLAYGTIGLAFGTVRARTINPAGPVVVSSSGSGVGWSGGGGIEVGIHGTSSIKAEWIWYDLGSTSHTVDTGLAAKVHETGSPIRIGFNHRFQ